MYLSQKQLSSGGNKLLPETTNLTSWLVSPTTDGKTVSNIMGTAANLTGINCLSFDGSGDRVTVNSVNDIDLSTDADNHFGACTITTHFMQTSTTEGGADPQVIHSCGAASYRLFAQNGKFKLNATSTEIFDVELNKLYKSTITFNSTGAATNFVLENITDGTTETYTTTVPAGGHNGASTFQIGARSNGLVFIGSILDFSISNSSVGANIHFPMQEGSGSLAYDISGNGANGTITGASWSTINNAVSHNTLYGFDDDYDVKVPVLINKTKQVATFDGVDDEVHFGLHTIPTTESVEVVFTPSEMSTRGCLYSQGSLPASQGFSLVYDGSLDRIFARHTQTSGSDNNIVTTNNSCPADTTTYKAIFDFDSSALTASLTLINNDTGATIETVNETGLSSNMFPSGESRNLKIGSDQNSLDDYLGTIHSIKSSLIDVDFSTNSGNIGGTTITDNSANGNNGTVSTGSTDLFWGRRVVDSSGSLLPANYYSGNEVISYPSGLLHNQSEVGFDLVTTDKTSADILGSTKTVVTFDGVADHVDFASALLNSASTFTVRVDIYKYERTVGSHAWVVGGQADKNFGLNKNNHIFYRDDDNTYLEFDGSGGTTDTSNLDLDGKSIVIKGSSDTIELFIDTVSYGTVSAGSGKGLFYASRYGLGYSTTAHAFKGSLSRVALWNTANDGQNLSTALVNHEFQSDVGSTTVQDTTANNNDGTVTVGSGGTSTFWEQQRAGASDSKNFTREDSNGNIIQYLQYSTSISGTSLIRTRNYVKSK